MTPEERAARKVERRRAELARIRQLGFEEGRRSAPPASDELIRRMQAIFARSSYWRTAARADGAVGQDHSSP